MLYQDFQYENMAWEHPSNHHKCFSSWEPFQVGHEPQLLQNDPYTILVLKEWFLQPIFTYVDFVPGFSTSDMAWEQPSNPNPSIHH